VFHVTLGEVWGTIAPCPGVEERLSQNLANDAALRSIVSLPPTPGVKPHVHVRPSCNNWQIYDTAYTQSCMDSIKPRRRGRRHHKAHLALRGWAKDCWFAETVTSDVCKRLQHGNMLCVYIQHNPSDEYVSAFCTWCNQNVTPPSCIMTSQTVQGNSAEYQPALLTPRDEAPTWVHGQSPASVSQGASPLKLEVFYRRVNGEAKFTVLSVFLQTA